MATKKAKRSQLKPGVVAAIPIDDLVPDPTQPRKAFPAKPLQELADNIKARGIRQPITVIQTAGGIVIKTGERRWRAAKLAGQKTVPCLLDPDADDEPQADDAARLVDQIAENDLREGLNPMERAEALGRMADSGLGPTEISEILERHGIRMARPTVSNLLRLRKLPDSIQSLISAGRLRESYARELLQFTDHPKILKAFVKQLGKEADNEIAKDVFADALEQSVYQHAIIINNREHNACKNCSCLAKVPDIYDEGYSWFCLEPDKIKAKRAAGAKGKEKPAEPAPAEKKKTETDPTKVKPVKVKPNEDGVVATSRRAWNSHKALRSADFDTSACEACPHQHLASHTGNKELATATCFYVPCFDSLARQHSRIVNRRETIRTMLDEQGIEPLLEVATRQPLANALVTPLLAFHTATNEGSFSFGGHDREGLQAIAGKTKRHNLADYLGRALSDEEASTVVGIIVSSLPKERRHELALYLSIDVVSFWKTDEAFAKLFRKAEIKEMLPNFDPPDVPVSEWQQRLIDHFSVPAILQEIWRADWIKGRREPDDEEEIGDRCRICGCTEFDPCPGGCQWVEDPVPEMSFEGLLLCSNPDCVAAAQAEATRLNKRESEAA